MTSSFVIISCSYNIFCFIYMKWAIIFYNVFVFGCQLINLNKHLSFSKIILYKIWHSWSKPRNPCTFSFCWFYFYRNATRSFYVYCNIDRKKLVKGLQKAGPLSTQRWHQAMTNNSPFITDHDTGNALISKLVAMKHIKGISMFYDTLIYPGFLTSNQPWTIQCCDSASVLLYWW